MQLVKIHIIRHLMAHSALACLFKYWLYNFSENLYITEVFCGSLPTSKTKFLNRKEEESVFNKASLILAE